MKKIELKKRVNPLDLGRDFTAKRALAIPTKTATVQKAQPSISFALSIQGKGAEIHLSPCWLETPELARLNRSLVASFASLLRWEVEGIKPADNLPALTSWIAANSLHWSLARTLHTLTRYRLASPGLIGEGLPSLTCLDAPVAMRADKYDGTEEQALRKAIGSGGWFTLHDRPPAKPIVKRELVFKRAMRGDDD